MPEYSFKCKNCGQKLNVFFKRIYQREPILCTNCDKELELVINFSGGFNLVGSGFYVNDYKAKKNNKDEKK